METETTTIKDWQKFKLIDICDFIRGSEPGTINYNRDKGTKFIRVSDVSKGVREPLFTNIDTNKLVLVKPEDVLITMDGSPGVVVRGFEGAISSGIRKIRLKSKDFDLNFIYFLLQTESLQDIIKLHSSGVTILHASKSIPNLQAIFPNLQEQKAIVKTLTTIKDAITGQENLIAKLKELKQSMMQHLFTHGIKGEKTKMTEIGEVPESWQIVPINSLSSNEMRNGAFVRRGQFGSGYLFANVVDMYGGLYLDYKKLDRVNISKKEIDRFILKDGDLLFVRSSLKRDGVAQCCVVRNLQERVTYDCHLIRVEINNSLAIPEFVANYWRSEHGRRELIQRSKTTTMTTINQDGLGAAYMPLPTLKEQEGIANALYSIDQNIEMAEKKLSVYQNLFKTLLHELMSGERRAK